MKANPDGSNEFLLPGNGEQGVVLYGGRVYWSNDYNSIDAMDVDGSNLTTTVAWTETNRPFALAVGGQ